jgi:hypothetical protein
MFKALMTNTHESTVPGDERMRRAAWEAAQNAAKVMESFAAFCTILRHRPPFCGLFGKIFSLECPHNHWRMGLGGRLPALHGRRDTRRYGCGCGRSGVANFGGYLRLFAFVCAFFGNIFHLASRSNAECGVEDPPHHFGGYVFPKDEDDGAWLVFMGWLMEGARVNFLP